VETWQSIAQMMYEKHYTKMYDDHEKTAELSRTISLEHLIYPRAKYWRHSAALPARIGGSLYHLFHDRNKNACFL
jgi:hypothetical protein